MDFSKASDKVPHGRLVQKVKLITSGHRFKVRGGRFKHDVRGTFFTQRVVSAWKSLPEVVDMIVTFKGHLDKYTNRMGIEGYGPRKGRGF